MIEQTIRLPPRATSFTAVCEACAVDHGYLAAQVAARLPLDVDHATATCARGHVIRVERTTRDAFAVRPRMWDAA